MEQTIVDLGRQLTELAAEIESWKFWLTLIVGIVAFIVAIGCAVIPAYTKAGVRKGTIEGTRQAIDALNKQEEMRKSIEQLQSQMKSLQKDLHSLSTDYKQLKRIAVTQEMWFDFPVEDEKLCYGKYSKYNDGSILLSGCFALPNTEFTQIAILPSGFRPSKEYTINLAVSDYTKCHSGYLTIKENGLIFARSMEPNIRFNFYVIIR